MRFAITFTVVALFVIALQQLGQGNGWLAGLAFAGFVAALSWLSVVSGPVEDEEQS